MAVDDGEVGKSKVVAQLAGHIYHSVCVCVCVVSAFGNVLGNLPLVPRVLVLSFIPACCSAYGVSYL